MPELPDIVVYLEALRTRILNEPLTGVRIVSPFLVRTVTPAITELQGKHVHSLQRLGKRIVIGFEDDLWLVLHLMIAGRLHWREPGGKLTRKLGLAALDFPNGSLVLTEAGTKKRASLNLVRGEQALRALNPGGLEVLDSTLEAFTRSLTARNHTLKRALTDPTLFSGIGNAYSDEILHRARLSPLALTRNLKPEEIARLREAARETLCEWIGRLRAQAAGGLPEKVTAFRPEM